MQSSLPVYIHHVGNHSNSSLDEDDTGFYLPNELWNHIFSYVAPMARPYLSLVCRRWAQIRLIQHAHEEALAFHKASLFVHALFKQKCWTSYQELQKEHPHPQSSPYSPSIETTRQDILKSIRVAEDRETLRNTISVANDWLTERIDEDNGQLQFVLAPDRHRKGFLMRTFVELARIHQHDDLALIHRMEVLLRRNIFYRVSIQEGSFLDLLRAGLFSVIRERKELIPTEFPEAYTDDFSLLQFDHTRALEFANSLQDEQDRQNYYQGPLKKMLSPQNTTFEHLRSSREMYAYRRFVSLLPPGDTKTYFQEDLFFQRLKWNDEDLEVHCVYDLDSLPQEHIESLYIAATINLALRGKNSKAHDFLRQISSIERQEELGVFLSRLTSSRGAPIEEELDPRDFQVDFRLKTLSEEESLEMAQQLGALHKPYVARRFRPREGIAPALNVFLDKLALCEWPSVRRVIDTCYGRQAHKFREEKTFLLTELSRKSSVILFEAVRWAVQYQSEEAFLEKTLPHLNASSVDFPIQYKAVSWLFRKHCRSYGFGLLYARLFDLLRKSEDTRDKLEEVLQAHPFLDNHDIPSLLKSLQACPIVNFLEDHIYRDSQMIFNQVYRQLLLHLEDHAPAFHRFLFQRHPQLQFLPERYYDLSVELLLPESE